MQRLDTDPTVDTEGEEATQPPLGDLALPVQTKSVAPEKPHRPRPRVAREADDPDARQLSLFGVEARPPATGDLEGLLAGAGQVVRMGGTARVSIVVDELWRARALRTELTGRGLTVTCVATVEQHIGVRTAYSTTLAALGASWLRGAVKLPPAGFALDGRRLRLWMIAGGHLDQLGCTLRLGPSDEQSWPAVGMALASMGLPTVLLGARAGGPAYRISGRRRIAHLAELVGDPPPGVPPGLWPTP